MDIISQLRLFEWTEVENLEDLERLLLSLENMPDEVLVRELEEERANGRDEYSIRAEWNAVLARVVYQHLLAEDFLRELGRNEQLRCICGFKPNKVTPSWAFSKFLSKLI